jgi:1,4-dihydroxy-2-naphthoate octaprenyltransferase
LLQNKYPTQTKPLQGMSSLHLWFHAIRPQTLWASVAPILLSQVLAYQLAGTFSWVVALLIFSCGISLQIAVNLGNDYFDHLKGIDGPAHLGPTRVIQKNLLSLQKIKHVFLSFLTLGITLGIVLVLLTYWQLLTIGIICIIAVLAYSGGSKPLASIALGEFAVFWVFGPITILGGFYAQSGELPNLLWFPAFQMGLLSAAIMLVNNIRDIPTDSLANKFTLPQAIGARPAQHLYSLSLLLSFIMIIGLASAVSLQLLISWLLLPLLIVLIRTIYRRKGAELNRQLIQTAQFNILSAVCLSADLFRVIY